MFTLAIANQKGGVGKTTTALALGQRWARQGRRVLLVDLDSQASLTTLALRPPIATPDAFVAHALLAACQRRPGPTLADTMAPAEPNRWVAAGNLELAGAELELARRQDHHALSRLLAPERHRWDAVLVDCPPSLGMLVVNALVAARGVVVPVVPEDLAVQGLDLLVGTVEHVVVAGLNPELELLGCILTMVQPRTGHQRRHLQRFLQLGPNLGARFGAVPRSIRVAEQAERLRRRQRQIPGFLSGAPGRAYAAAADRLAEALVFRGWWPAADGTTPTPVPRDDDRWLRWANATWEEAAAPEPAEATPASHRIPEVSAC